MRDKEGEDLGGREKKPTMMELPAIVHGNQRRSDILNSVMRKILLNKFQYFYNFICEFHNSYVTCVHVQIPQRVLQLFFSTPTRTHTHLLCV